MQPDTQVQKFNFVPPTFPPPPYTTIFNQYFVIQSKQILLFVLL